MKKPAFLIVSTFLLFFVSAQSLHLHKADGQACLPEGIIFTTQAQIDSFQDNHPGCSIIQGGVTISGEDITNLAGLISLTTIGGDLLLYGSDLLAELTGLENLTKVSGSMFIGSSAMAQGNASLKDLRGLGNVSEIGGMLQIAKNDQLNNIESLNNLDTIGGYLDINNNPSLKSLNGLEHIQGAKLVAVYQNKLLHDLSGLGNLRWIDLELFIGQNSTLVNLHGLDNLESVNGLVDIWDNPVLNDLHGLEGLTSIGGYLWISENDTLMSLAALYNLVSIAGEIALNENASLTSLSGLDNIPASSILALTIHDNHALYDCAMENICAYLSLPEATVTISDNAMYCNTSHEITASCNPESSDNTSSYPLEIHPNPSVSGTITITYKKIQASSYLACINSYGKQVCKREITDTETVINVSTWAPGIYLAVVYGDGKVVGRARFVVQ